jgi:hypothetical protein
MPRNESDRLAFQHLRLKMLRRNRLGEIGHNLDSGRAYGFGARIAGLLRSSLAAIYSVTCSVVVIVSPFSA